MPKLKTAAEGAADERRLWMRKVREMWGSTTDLKVRSAMDVLLAYGKRRVERNAKPGGQGRK